MNGIHAHFERPDGRPGRITRIVLRGNVPLELAEAMQRGFAADGHDCLVVDSTAMLANAMVALLCDPPNVNSARGMLGDAVLSEEDEPIDRGQIVSGDLGITFDPRGGSCGIEVTGAYMAVSYLDGASALALAFAEAAGIPDEAIPPELREAAAASEPACRPHSGHGIDMTTVERLPRD